MSAKPFTRSFAGGEIAPLLAGRLDLAKFQTGLAKCLNFEVTPQGPIQNRTGFEFVAKLNTTGPAVLIPFSYNALQSFAIEFGDRYIRFHTQGASLLEAAKSVNSATNASPGVFEVVGHGYANGEGVFFANMGTMPAMTGRSGTVVVVDANHISVLDIWGVPIDTSAFPVYGGGGTVSRVYTISSPYESADVFDLHYVQSADVLTITHQSHPPMELRRLGAAFWTLTAPSFVPTVATPGAPTALAGGPGGGVPDTHTYAATAVSSDTLEESLVSQAVSASSDLTVAGNYVEVQPALVDGVVRYNIFKLQSGIFGFIGQTDGSAFRDSNIVPDLSTTPPLAANPFASDAIVSVPVTAGGVNYGGGVITSTAVTAGGTGYTTPPTVTVSGGGSGAVLTAVLTGASVTSVTVTNGGHGYAAPTLTFSGGGGTGATATATASTAGKPILTVTDASGTGARLEPVVVAGVITGVRVAQGGSGYTAPTVTVTTPFGGSGATFGAATLTGTDVYPQAVSYFEQRRCFGGSASLQQTVWATRSATESNMSYSIPTQDDDAIRARIVSRDAQVVRHLLPLNDLLALTSGGLWRLSPASGDALTPANISPKQHSSVGASMVQPMLTSSAILYAPARGSHIREVSFQWQTQQYQAEDVAVMAPHLFDFYGITQMAYASTPLQVLWATRSDGTLLGLTYQPEHEVKAWHQHTTQGTFESVCAIPEGDEDGVYAIIRRTINGQSLRYIERMHSRNFAAPKDAFFVDAGLTYSGAPANVITGLWHLEGAAVTVLADGGLEQPLTVTNGAITLPAPASTVHVGLGYNSDAQTLPMTIETMAAFGQGVVKNINEVALRVVASSNIMAGPSFDKLRSYPQRSAADNYGAAPGQVTGVVHLKITPSWQEDGSVCIRQSAPLPLMLVAMTVEAATGG